MLDSSHVLSYPQSIVRVVNVSDWRTLFQALLRQHLRNIKQIGSGATLVWQRVDVEVTLDNHLKVSRMIRDDVQVVACPSQIEISFELTLFEHFNRNRGIDETAWPDKQMIAEVTLTKRADGSYEQKAMVREI